MPLFRLSVVEEYVTARDEEDAIGEAFMGVDDSSWEFAGYINTEEITEPTATVYLTRDELHMIQSASFRLPLAGRNSYIATQRGIEEKVSQAYMQLAVQTVMVEREGE